MWRAGNYPLNGYNWQDIRPILEEHNLPSDIDPNEWYSLQDWLDVLGDITEGPVWLDYLSAGMRIVETVAPPPPSVDVDRFSFCLNAAFHAQHRNGDIGQYRVEQVGDQHIKVVADTPYPDDLHYGICYAYAQHCLPPGTAFHIWYDECVVADPASPTTIHITWA